MPLCCRCPDSAGQVEKPGRVVAETAQKNPETALLLLASNYCVPVARTLSFNT